MTIEAIKLAILKLNQQERADLATWLNSLEHDAWDVQMVRDFSHGGRGMKLLPQVQRQIEKGQSNQLSIPINPQAQN